jgi:hypothetical protein
MRLERFDCRYGRFFLLLAAKVCLGAAAEISVHLAADIVISIDVAVEWLHDFAREEIGVVPRLLGFRLG